MGSKGLSQLSILIGLIAAKLTIKQEVAETNALGATNKHWIKSYTPITLALSANSLPPIPRLLRIGAIDSPGLSDKNNIREPAMHNFRFCLLLCFSFALFSCARTNAADAPPNIVILFADDLGYGDLGSFGHPYIRTPNIDSMAQQGQKWTDFYVASPVCSPSRAALLTGNLPVRNGMYGRRLAVYFPNEDGGLPESETTIAEALKARGYATGIFGKWHLGDAEHAYPTNHGFDEWLGVPFSNDMNWVGDPTYDELFQAAASGDSERYASVGPSRAAKYADPQAEDFETPLISSTAGGESSIEQPSNQALFTRRYTEAAIDFMTRKREQPFFVYLPYTMVHTPLFASDEFTGRSLAGRYGDVVEEIDWSVGEIRRALERLELAENTLVVFTSDNGPWLTMNEEGGLAGSLRMGKGSTFEGGVRVPTIFYWPGTIRSGVISELGSTLDLFATVSNLAGIENATGVDGYDLSDTLTEGSASPRLEMPFYRRGELYAYRAGPWKLHFILEGAYGQPPERTDLAVPQLFNLMKDPSERFDVAAENPEIVQQIMAAVAQHQAGLEIAEPEFDRRWGRYE